MRANSLARAARLILLAVGTVAVTGGECKKEADFFDPVIQSDGVIDEPGSIMGTVTVDGSPRPGVVVTLDGATSATTGSNGMYAFDPVEPGSHLVAVTPPSGTTCDPASRSVNVPSGGSATADFACATRPGTITGTVTVDGMPRSGVTVTLDGGQTETTDGEGKYVFDPVDAGSHTVVVTPPSGTTCDPESQSVDVPPGGPATADFACATTSSSAFALMLQTGWTHPSGSNTSIACGAVSTDPAQSGASFVAQLSGPGVVGEGRVQGSLDAQGEADYESDISQTGDYMWEVTVDAGSNGTQEASSSFTVTGSPNSCPQLTQSSARFKREVRSLLPEGERILGLRPVTFRYVLPYGDPGTRRVGLIAEEVYEIYPEIVVLDSAGRPYAIRYDRLPGVLLQELAGRIGLR